MSTRFKTLFTVSISHPYYDVPCRDLAFTVPPSTAALLDGGRLLARENEGRLIVLYEADTGGLPLRDIHGQALVFGLRLQNPYFDNFTVPVLATPGTVPMYANAAAPGTLGAAAGVVLVSGLYAHEPLQVTRPVTLSLRRPGGTTVAVQAHAAGGPAPAFDLRALPAGTWQVFEDYGGGAALARTLFSASDVAGTGLWGLTAITVDAAFHGAPPDFSIDFVPRQETLQYYVVGDIDPASTNLNQAA